MATKFFVAKRGTPNWTTWIVYRRFFWFWGIGIAVFASRSAADSYARRANDYWTGSWS